MVQHAHSTVSEEAVQEVDDRGDFGGLPISKPPALAKDNKKNSVVLRHKQKEIRKMISFPVNLSDYKRLRKEAAKRGTTTTDIVRSWVMPQVEKLPMANDP